MSAGVIVFGSLLIQQYAHNQQHGHAHRHNTDINNHSVRQKLQLNGYDGYVKARIIVVKDCTLAYIHTTNDY
ncbi:hypothetical protein BVZ25_19955 [Klebsiella quasipneumoniae]|nr:hypothetical protein BVZ25_19955 [Klebsiella quasipneumoniae]OVX17088.1 hypothetical protein BME39_15840 [Klebsiella quasipneumoniae subsp. similipneumoniae]GKP91018.1 hypothetical protein NUKP71_24390 [Klebsiella quasipneumoniae]